MSVNHAQRMVTRQNRSCLDDGRPGYRFASTPVRRVIAKITSQETGSQMETIITSLRLVQVKNHKKRCMGVD